MIVTPTSGTMLVIESEGTKERKNEVPFIMTTLVLRVRVMLLSARFAIHLLDMLKGDTEISTNT